MFVGGESWQVCIASEISVLVETEPVEGARARRLRLSGLADMKAVAIASKGSALHGRNQSTCSHPLTTIEALKLQSAGNLIASPVTAKTTSHNDLQSSTALRLGEYPKLNMSSPPPPPPL